MGVRSETSTAFKAKDGMVREASGDNQKLSPSFLSFSKDNTWRRNRGGGEMARISSERRKKGRFFKLKQ